MLHTIDIPSPSAADDETVVTALETAAIFGAKGDAQEAMRWLRRAAESAGAAGDDERALSLSRVAAELHDELSGTRPVASPRPVPSSPPRPVPSSPPRPVPSPPPPASVSYPPPPSSRTAPPAPEAAAPEPTPTSSTGARHAARVAVSISTSKVGYLEVRLLAEGEAPRLGAAEGLLVMLDPASTLLSR